jgi:hypothetical protein
MRRDFTGGSVLDTYIHHKERAQIGLHLSLIFLFDCVQEALLIELKNNLTLFKSNLILIKSFHLR